MDVWDLRGEIRLVRKGKKKKTCACVGLRLVLGFGTEENLGIGVVHFLKSN